MKDRIDTLLSFLEEAEKLKLVERRNRISGGSAQRAARSILTISPCGPWFFHRTCRAALISCGRWN